MRVTELLKKESTELGAKVSDKREAIDRLVPLMDVDGKLKDTAGYKEGVLTREALGSTAIGEGIVIPHAKTGAVEEPGSVTMAVPEGIGYDAFDSSLAGLLFMVATPAEGTDARLEVSPRLFVLLMSPGLKEGFIGAADKDEFLRIIDEMEAGRFGAPEGETGQNAREDTETGAETGTKTRTGAEANTSSGYQVSVATVCPTGITHTYMAAENPEDIGEKLEIALKAKTGSSGGVQNVLTREEIAAVDAIITAVDKNVEMARSDGKPAIMVPAASSIHKAEELIKWTVDGMVLVHRYIGAVGGESVLEGSNSIGWVTHKHLVNGVFHMPPSVTGGGILIALALLFSGYSINSASSGKNAPLAAYLRTAGKQAFGMILPILAGFIAMSIVNRPDLAVGLVTGLITKTGAIFTNPVGGDMNIGFLGALFTGLVSGYTVVGLRKFFSRLLRSLEGIGLMLLHLITSIFLAAVVITLVNPYMDVINNGPTHFPNGMDGISRIVLGTVLDGIVSVDTGGPFNKTVHVFGTIQLAGGNFEVMVAVMAGGVVSPIAIVLCTSFFKRKFAAKERQPGVANYAMGLSFIIEGATSLAAQGLLRVIPSCIIGFATAEGLSMVFGYTLRAPHGGISVLLVIRSPFMYLVVVVAEAAVGRVILRMLKKNAEEQRRIRYAMLRLIGEYLAIKI